jgi:hypothetical protein
MVAAGAIACSSLTIVSCDFFQLIAAIGENNTTMLDLSTVPRIGIFSYQIDQAGTCRAYLDTGTTLFQPSDWMGTIWIIAQYAALLAPALGALASLLTLAELMFGKFSGSFLVPALLYLLACASQGITFFTYNEEDVCFKLDADEMEITDSIIRNSCQLSMGAFFSISAGFLYYVCSVLLCCLPRPNYHCCSCCCGGKKTATGQEEDDSSGSNRKAVTVSESSRELDVENPSQGEDEDRNGSVAASPPNQQIRPWQQYD